TKQVGAGSGLGLSVVSGFCRQSGGGLMLASEPGQGARVSMVFPLQRGTVVKPTGAPESARADDITRRDILIVDDEVQVTRVLARQLLLDGHRVRVAPNAEQALAMLAAEPLPDLVLSDLVMPGNVQGDALARIIADRHPSVRVIVMSGYESARRRGQMDATGDMPFLQKPIDRTQLRAAVSAAFSR
ncbi:response regulator, partial [Puniceibacterium confluentis]